MKCIHIVGRRNHGKTTLIVELVAELRRRDIAVGAIKHSRHAHELDTPGKDSYRYRHAGAVPAAVIAEHLIGLWLPRDAAADPYTVLASMFAQCQVVLVEGDIDCEGIKVEVWRRAAGGHCLAETRRDIRAVVSDDPLELSTSVWPRSNISALATRLLELL
jgi:molybdopterin-guanine dinucleotide biosynthesis protein B